MHVAARILPACCSIPLYARKPERHPGLFDLRQTVSNISNIPLHVLEKTTSSRAEFRAVDVWSVETSGPEEAAVA